MCWLHVGTKPSVLSWMSWVRFLCTDSSHVHYGDVIMGAIASQITSLTIVYSTVYSDADHRKYQSSASLAFVRGIHRSPVNSPHKWAVTRKMFPFDDVIMPLMPWLITSPGHQESGYWLCGKITMPTFHTRCITLWASSNDTRYTHTHIYIYIYISLCRQRNRHAKS